MKFGACGVFRLVSSSSYPVSPSMADEDEEELFPGEKAPEPATTKLNAALVHLHTKLLVGCCGLVTLVTFLVRPRDQNSASHPLASS